MSTTAQRAEDTSLEDSLCDVCKQISFSEIKECFTWFPLESEEGLDRSVENGRSIGVFSTIEHVRSVDSSRAAAWRKRMKMKGKKSGPTPVTAQGPGG